jgi:hypothetical protein
MRWSFRYAFDVQVSRCRFVVPSTNRLTATMLVVRHIYVYQAPAWFVYLLRAYCFPPGSKYIY